MTPELEEYRRHLILAEQKAQEDYDKTVIALSGGALAVSFAFLEKVVSPRPIEAPAFLLAAWLSWGLSVAVMLCSYLASNRALRAAITRIDRSEVSSRGTPDRLGALTDLLNVTGGTLFLLGVIAISFFAAKNLTGP